ncbi:MAG: hypothetical protein WHT08_14265 [Bryobacteraceae bacterium]
MKPSPRLKAMQELWQKEKLAEVSRELKQKAARRRPNLKDFERLSLEGRRALSPWLELALRGVTAGIYLRPSDLPVSEDPWLLRKHLYTGAYQMQEEVFPVPEFRAESEGAGSLPMGSLGGIADVSGHIALAGQRAAGGFAEIVEVKQVAALRSALLHRLRAEDLRAVRLAILAGREWVVEAAYDAAESAELERRATGLVSPERLGRASRLLLRLRNIHGVIVTARPFRGEYEALWRSVWDCFSLSDLFWLGRNRRQGKEQSVAWHALQKLPKEIWDGPVQELGAVPLEHARSAMPRLTPLPPYESYALELLPARMAERVSELSLALASAADEAGLEPDALALIAEPFARRLMKGLQMSDLADFRAAVELWKRVRAEDLEATYEEESGKGP